MKRSRLTGRLRRDEGAAAVEFALIAGVLALLLFGMMEYGLFFLQAQTLKSGAREGARQAAVGADLTAVKLAVSNGSGGAISGTSPAISMSLSGSTQTSCTTTTSDDTQGKEVTVTIDTGSGANYPAGLTSSTITSFKIDVPFLPHFDIHPGISGTFRCEV
ncbi:MAG TPA: TadE/TadG family type IV pilus assembly protein [Actinomycetota bacterium]|jgi:Flp pilus assembly protein TadG|nr:TadE/TadG family type IV pilus assembly protein [Actinomycetota bacterium]